MSDIDKKIAELKELRAKATAGPLGVKNGVVYALNDDHTPAISNTGALMRVLSGREADADLYFAMHNYLPELIVEIEHKREFATSALAREEDARANARNAGKERDAAIARADKAENALFMETEIINDYGKWKTDFERIQKERDRLIARLVDECNLCPISSIECRNSMRTCKDTILKWLAEEIAKDEENQNG